MARKPKSTSTEFALKAAAELAKPLPEPPISLSPEAQEIWPKVIRAKMLDLWTDLDLHDAAQLCERMAERESLNATVRPGGTIIKVPMRDRARNLLRDDKGAILYEFKDHPVIQQIRDLTCLIQKMKRDLQINSVAVNGKTDHLAGKNQAARGIAAAIDDDEHEGYFAKPKVQRVK